VQLQEALGQPPDLKKFGTSKFTFGADVLSADVDEAWGIYTEAIRKALEASKTPPAAPQPVQHEPLPASTIAVQPTPQPAPVPAPETPAPAAPAPPAANLAPPRLAQRPPPSRPGTRGASEPAEPQEQSKPRRWLRGLRRSG